MVISERAKRALTIGEIEGWNRCTKPYKEYVFDKREWYRKKYYEIKTGSDNKPKFIEYYKYRVENSIIKKYSSFDGLMKYFEKINNNEFCKEKIIIDNYDVTLIDTAADKIIISSKYDKTIYLIDSLQEIIIHYLKN